MKYSLSSRPCCFVLHIVLSPAVPIAAFLVPQRGLTRGKAEPYSGDRLNLKNCLPVFFEDNLKLYIIEKNY